MPAIILALIVMIPAMAHASSKWLMTFRQFEAPSAMQRIDCAGRACTGTITILTGGVQRRVDVAATMDGEEVSLAFDDPTGKASYRWTARKPFKITVGRTGRGDRAITLMGARLVEPNDAQEDLVHRQYPGAAHLEVDVEADH